MSNTVPQPMSRRDVWLTVALAIARHGLPTPEDMRVTDSGVYITVDTHAHVRAWGEHLGIDLEAPIDRDGGKPYSGARWIVAAWGHALGRSCRVSATVEHLDDRPEPSPLADELAEAIGAAS